MASTAARFRLEDCVSVHAHTQQAKEKKKSATTALSTLVRVRVINLRTSERLESFFFFLFTDV